MMSKPNSKFAVFDIDGTLYRWQLFHELVQELAFNNTFPKSAYRDIDNYWNQWRGGTISFAEYEHQIVNIMTTNLPRVPIEVYEKACDSVIEQSAHKTHHYTRGLLKDLKAAGYTICTISGSQQELLDRFAKRYNIDIAIGALYERKNGVFTGKIERDIIGRKGELYQQLINDYGFSTSGSVAVGDSESDIPMLELAETAIAFNPSEGLLSHARSHGWKIVVERKNIAYEMVIDDNRLAITDTIVY